MSRRSGLMAPETSMVRPRALGEREQRLSGLLRYQGQVDWHSGEGPLVGAAEQEQGLGEVDRSGVDSVEAFDELAGVAVRIVAGDVEKCLRDRQRGAQLVGGVGCEPLLLGDVCFEPRKHRVEGVGELAELVVAALQVDPVGERSFRGQTRGPGDASQGREHGAGEDPSAQEAEHQQEAQHGGCLRDEGALEVGPVGTDVAARGCTRRVRSAAGTPTRPRAAGRWQP